MQSWGVHQLDSHKVFDVHGTVSSCAFHLCQSLCNCCHFLEQAQDTKSARHQRELRVTYQDSMTHQHTLHVRCHVGLLVPMLVPLSAPCSQVQRCG